MLMSAKVKISKGNASQVVPDDGLPLEHLPHHNELLFADRLRDDLPARPEIFLTLPRYQPGELALLPGAVDADWSHPVSPAEVLSLALSEASAAQPPADQEVLTSKLMVGTVTSTTPGP